jgi:hypothetical protein
LPFHEGSGTTLNDLSGNRHTAAFTGTWTGDAFGSAISTNGSTTEANITGNANLNVQTGGDFTVSVGFNPTSLASSYTALFDFGASGTPNRNISLFLNAGGGAGAIFWQVGNGTGGSDGVLIGQTITAGKQWNITVPRKGGVASFYVNGRFGVTNSAQTGTSTFAGNLSLGLNPTTGGAKFNGKYDYFYLWNRALSSDEVKQLAYDPFIFYRPESRWWEASPTGGVTFTNRPGPRVGPALPFGLVIGGAYGAAKALERNSTVRRRALLRWWE